MIPFDGQTVHDSDTFLQITNLPHSLCVVGAGVIGCEYATMCAVMGCNVRLVDNHRELLFFLDREVSSALLEHMRDLGIQVWQQTRIESVEASGPNGLVHARRDTGEPIEAEMFLYAAGRNGNTAELHCEKAG